MKSGSPDFGYIWYQLLKYIECLTCFLKKKDDFHWKKKRKEKLIFFLLFDSSKKNPWKELSVSGIMQLN